MNVRMGLVPECDRLIDTSHPGPEGQVHRASRGTPRTGATATSGEGSHKHERDADDSERGCKASHPRERGEKLHRLKPPLRVKIRKLPCYSQSALRKPTYDVR